MAFGTPGAGDSDPSWLARLFELRIVRRGVIGVIVITTGAFAGVVLARLGSSGGQYVVYPRIAAAGDIACYPGWDSFNDGLGTPSACRQRYTADLLTGRSHDAVLALGDLQYEEGALDSFHASYDPSWGQVREITRPVPGEHEYGTPGAAGYFDYFNGVGQSTGRAGHRDRGYYAFAIRSWRIIALNSACSEVGGCEEGSPQYEWLGRKLRKPAECLLAYWHVPLFSSGVHGGSSSVRDFWVLLDKADADVVLNGHEHFYERFAPQDADGNANAEGIRQFTVGTGGTGGEDLRDVVEVAANSEVRETETFGVLEITLKDGEYEWRFLPEAGASFTDSGTGSC